MPFKLSPSALNLMKDCPRCFWLDKHKVWIMPEGATRRKQLKKMPKVMEYCIEKGFMFSPRIHVLSLLVYWNIISILNCMELFNFDRMECVSSGLDLGESYLNN